MNEPTRPLVQDGESLVFEDHFHEFDLSVWKHEITMAGGGNWEFQYYTNNRTNSFVEGGVLFLQPTLLADRIGDACVSGDVPYTMSLWGLTPADQCTSNAYYGCERRSDKGARIALNPIQSARVSTAGRFHIKYGRVEVEAKIPVGDWIWPAIWLLPAHNSYGSWPASGEIDVMESRGNAKGYCNDDSQTAGLCPGGNDKVSSSLHWGPYPGQNGYERTTATKKMEGGQSFGDEFHTYGLSWDDTGLIVSPKDCDVALIFWDPDNYKSVCPKRMTMAKVNAATKYQSEHTYVDTEDNRVLSVAFDQSFWKRGGFDQLNVDDPWEGRPSAAPFDQGFFLVMNVAVGGVGGFFPDGQGDKPWSDQDPDAPLKFWEAKDQWYPTWKGRDSALQVKSVKVWQKPGGETFNAAASRPSDTQQMGSVANLPLPEAPSTAAMDRGVGNTPYHFILAATVINSFLLMSVIIAWSLSFYRRQCATCGNDRVSKNSGGLLGGVGALAGGRAGGYRRARTADPASLGPEVEISTY